QNAALKTLFYKLCNLQHAPVTAVLVFDGPGRPEVKRGTRRAVNTPLWLTVPLKELITAFGYYFFTAPGEAEAELAQLNKLGFIDAIITEDSDPAVFGATCIVRTSGPSMADAAEVYRSESLAGHPLYLDEDGLLLFALLVGGDYDAGIPGCGSKIAHALARCGFGRDLRQILTSSDGARQKDRLDAWRTALKAELSNNSSGLLDRRHRKLADNIPGDFPKLNIVRLYMDPLTSWSPRYDGTSPDTSLWVPREPTIHRVYTCCGTHFQWQEVILDRLKSNFWPGVALRMIFSVCYLFFKLFNTLNTDKEICYL
ncbi:PIN domain-like protein, partial [Mycena olivaceomarginata]